MQGERKQLEWMENLRALTSDPSVSIEGDVRDLLGQVMEHENIPRKRAKFTNFVKNIRRGVRPTTIDKTWELFEQALKKKDTAPEAKKEEESEDTSQKLEDISHGNVAVEKEGKSKKKKKEKKRKKQEKEEEVVAASVENGANTNGEDVEERDGIKMFKGTKKFKKKDKNKKGEKDEIAKLSKDQMEAENGIEDSEKSKKKKKKKEKKRMENGCVNEEETQKKEKTKKRKKEGPEQNGAGTEEDEQPTPKKSKKAKFDWEEVIVEVLSKKGGKMKVTANRQR